METKSTRGFFPVTHSIHRNPIAANFFRPVFALFFSPQLVMRIHDNIL